MSGFCKTLLLLLIISLVTTHRLTAPIVDETPTPKPKIKPKSENQSQETKKKESKLAITAFVGTWRGSVTVSGQLGDWPISGNASRTVLISSDGTVTYFGQSGGQTGPQSQSKAVLSRDGRSASWTNQQTQQGMTSRGTFSLQLASSNSATYQEDGVFSSSEASGSLKASGTLTRQ